ncbi:rhomboid family intramembrane serine protease [Candidatus Woesearchaeota archaeon]|nr:rhomboid family intramembrane serine protease [Candidatus Woesearchaeota archaeon]
MIYSTFLITGLISLFFVIQSIVHGFTNAFVMKQSSLFSQPWRLLTSIFLHSGIVHLLYNLLSLVLFGIILENILGTRRFLVLFFVSGIISSFFAGVFYKESLGASGAIFGIIGTLVILRPKLMIWVYGMPMHMFLAGIIYFFVNLIGAYLNVGNTGYIAHLSGLLIGLIFGFFYYKRFKPAKIEKLKLHEIDLRKIDEWEKRRYKEL